MTVKRRTELRGRGPPISEFEWNHASEGAKLASSRHPPAPRPPPPSVPRLTPVCAPANEELASRLQKLFETAYTHVGGEYFPCHPEMCGPLTEEEKGRVDSRFATCKSGDAPCPRPLFF